MRSAANLGWQLALLGLILVAILGVRPGQVSGFSMQPGIASNEYVIINALAYKIGTPHHGEIVAFRHERSAPSVYLKRIIGLPGDDIAIASGVVSLNGAPLVEPYVKFRDARSFRPTRVPPGAYYVLGDNRAHSDDSRAWGFVPSDDIIGRAMFAIWPPRYFGPLP